MYDGRICFTEVTKEEKSHVNNEDKMKITSTMLQTTSLMGAMPHFSRQSHS